METIYIRALSFWSDQNAADGCVRVCSRRGCTRFAYADVCLGICVSGSKEYSRFPHKSI